MRFYLIVLSCIFSFSCNRIKNENELANTAYLMYVDLKDDLNIESYPFKGPKRVPNPGKKVNDSSYKTFEWWYIHEKDTFSIYSVVSVNNKKSYCSSSPNLTLLELKKKEWLNKEQLTPKH